jgi:DNA-binding beta-propeller fold protein YncE
MTFRVLFALSFVAAAFGQPAPNSQPNPYRTIENYLQLPEGRTMGSSSAIDIDRAGNIWVADRCAANSCVGSQLAPVMKFDSKGKLLSSFGAGMFVFPHGITIDPDGNVWVSDGQGRGGKGHQVIKFSPDGKVLMTLGKAGEAGDGPDQFNQPSAVAFGRNGDIFVADGHGGNTNARIVKFTKDGKFIKTWGKKGTGPGEFDAPHALAFDSKGRLFVADRGNSRIQIFDQDGAFIDQWTQFSRPSGIFIDKNDVIYVSDSESREKAGYVVAFIPDTDPDPEAKATTGAEGVVADVSGAIYGAEVGQKDVKKYVKK